MRKKYKKNGRYLEKNKELSEQEKIKKPKGRKNRTEKTANRKKNWKPGVFIPYNREEKLKNSKPDPNERSID